ncbi:MAG: hypothetical protein KKD63_16735 [Proteobacteria bacterium]|nr:hypothetical protein [Desulfobulbaceae bacterium]MBU4154519.1 hypothetical protein [Pseudomonadota bacterium]
MDPKTLFEHAQKHWHKPIGLFVAVVGLLLFEVVISSNLSLSWLINLVVYVISIFAVIGVWYWSNRLPKTPDGKVGFTVSIACSNEQEKRKIREDFIITLQSLIKNGTSGNSFHFYEVPQHIAETINDKDQALVLKQKTRSHFVIYGRVRFRKINGVDCYHLDLEGAVAHKPIDKKFSDQISKEFTELFPRKVSIPTDNDLLSFTFTTEWTEFVAKYIIGIAAFCSGDLNYAERLYQELQAKLISTDGSFPVFVKLKERLPARLSEIYLTRALSILDAWTQSNDKHLIPLLSENTDKIEDKFDNDYRILLLKQITPFLSRRDVSKAKSYVKKCKKYNDVIWHFNLAFLDAYEEDLRNAVRQYRVCSSFPVQANTLSQIEDFLCWILSEEPDKYQFHYCLGFFNWKIKGDLKQAITDFKLFLDYPEESKFHKEKELAGKWIEEIETSLQKNKQKQLNMSNQAFELTG